jgi:predicted DCC family thiol-disulfide oxidoreductase YuxK
MSAAEADAGTGLTRGHRVLPDDPVNAPAVGRLVVLYDRDCGLCTATARALRRWDRRGRLVLVPLQDVDREVPLVAAAVDGLPLDVALHVVDEATGRVAVGGGSVLAIASRLPGGRLADVLARVPPIRWGIGVAYDVVARNRHRIGRWLRLEGPACDVPQ